MLILSRAEIGLRTREQGSLSRRLPLCGLGRSPGVHRVRPLLRPSGEGPASVLQLRGAVLCSWPTSGSQALLTVRQAFASDTIIFSLLPVESLQLETEAFTQAFSTWGFPTVLIYSSRMSLPSPPRRPSLIPLPLRAPGEDEGSGCFLL